MAWYDPSSWGANDWFSDTFGTTWDNVVGGYHSTLESAYDTYGDAVIPPEIKRVNE